MPQLPIDWKLLTELRERFLGESSHPLKPYWNDENLLDLYDRTFAERIGWKWDSVLQESQKVLEPLKALKPMLVDWGCGTGIASRRFLHFFGENNVSAVTVSDHSPLSEQFAKQKLREEYPGIQIKALTGEPSSPYLLLISHVLGELGLNFPAGLNQLIENAAAIIWVEPGTPTLSRRLIDLRESLKADFDILAPCPHQNECGLLKIENATHWCHHFAKVPIIAFQDALWTRFSKELRIDLRSLPVSYLVLMKKSPENSNAPAPNRVIGRARIYKGYLLALVCDASGVNERRLLERQAPEAFKRLKHGAFHLTYLA